MLAIFHGNDTIKVRESALNFAGHEAEGAPYQLVETESFAEGALEAWAGETSLFGDKRVYVLDNLFSTKDGLETLIDKAGSLSSSLNVFVVIEGSLLAPTKNKLAKQADFI